MTESHRIPLFPLGVVILPGMRLPLHIFEERYKQMIGGNGHPPKRILDQLEIKGPA